MSPKMFFQPTGRQVTIRNEESILDLAIRAKIPIAHSCGGMGSCGTRRVLVTDGLAAITPRNELEEEMASSRGFNENERLACQTLPNDGLVVKIP